jgi:hypothetical protein
LANLHTNTHTTRKTIKEQQPEEYYYPEEMPELIRNTEESSVSSDSENTEPSDEEIEKSGVSRALV